MKGYKCDTCGKVFGGVSGFDIHRTGQYEEGHNVGKGKKTRYKVTRPNTRRCLTDKQCEARGLHLKDGVWMQAYGGKSAA